MEIFRINGGNRLYGEINVRGAKNSILPVLAASVIACGETEIHNCPDISDVRAAIGILRHLGCRVSYDGECVSVNSASMSQCAIPDALMREMRSSVIFLGAILARSGEAELSLPGGCELGPRPIGMHLDALRSLGAEISEKGEKIVCRAGRLKGGSICLPMPSVGATENSIIAAVSCDGDTVITNAACEPEIKDLQDFLNTVGASVHGAGTPTITVRGGLSESKRCFTVIPDRIAAATYLSAAAAAGGSITVKNAVPEHIGTVTDILSGMGCRVKCFSTLR